MSSTHFDYKIITQSSCPSTEELNKFFDSRKYSVWRDQYYYSYVLPTTKMLVDEAHSRLQDEIRNHLNEGWKLQGSIFISRKETKVYTLQSGKLASYDIISYSQALTKEESMEDYLKRTQTQPIDPPKQDELENLKKQIADIQAKLQSISPPTEATS